MKHYSRHVQGWSLHLPIYANRTKIEGEIADFAECVFLPTTTIDKLKRRIETYLKTLPPDARAKFKVTKQRAGYMDTESGRIEWFRVSVQYKTRWVVSIREPNTIPVKPC